MNRIIAIKLLKEGMAIDSGRIAKGFAADEVLKIYKEYDIKGGIISFEGSSIYTVGQKPDGTPWNIGIKHHRKDSDQDYAGIINANPFIVVCSASIRTADEDG